MNPSNPWGRGNWDPANLAKLGPQNPSRMRTREFIDYDNNGIDDRDQKEAKDNETPYMGYGDIIHGKGPKVGGSLKLYGDGPLNWSDEQQGAWEARDQAIGRHQDKIFQQERERIANQKLNEQTAAQRRKLLTWTERVKQQNAKQQGQPASGSGSSAGGALSGGGSINWKRRRRAGSGMSVLRDYPA